MFFKTHYKALCSYAYSYLKDPADAEEVVQNAFVAFWEKRSTLQITASAKSYLFAMVRNACLNNLKHEKIKQRYAGAAALAEEGYDPVSATIHSDELSEKIRSAIDTLPEQCRLVFKLSRFEELKYQEIATELNISVKTVENHMGKALKLMREQLKEFLPALLVMTGSIIYNLIATIVG